MGFLTASEHCWQRPNLLLASVLSGGLHNARLLGDCLDHFWCKFCCCRCHEMFLQVIIPSFSLFHKCWHPLMFRFGCYKISWAHAMACFQLMVHQLMVLPFYQMCAPVYQDWPVFVFCLLYQLKWPVKFGGNSVGYADMNWGNWLLGPPNSMPNQGVVKGPCLNCPKWARSWWS